MLRVSQAARVFAIPQAQILSFTHIYLWQYRVSMLAVPGSVFQAEPSVLICIRAWGKFVSAY